MIKNVLILCTGNSCRSIIAEALINARYPESIFAQSSGVRASGTVNPNAQALLRAKDEWSDRYHSKEINTVLDTAFDLIITVCDHAKESCPVFPKAVKTIHLAFEDPDTKNYEAFENLYKEIEDILLPRIIEELKDV